MRKVKFRAQAMADKKWIYGAYQSSSPDYLFDTFPKGLTAEVIIPETVGEFTGMEDINKKKMFEDDIVQNKQDDGIYKLGKIAMRYGSWVILHFDNGFTNLHWALRFQKISVIGNTFDNPEFMEITNG